MVADAEVGIAVGLVLPSWIEDWNSHSREHVGGPLGYTTLGATYFARLDYVNANLPTKRRQRWHVVSSAEGATARDNADGDEQYILMPDAVRTTFPASAASPADLNVELARHLRDVLVNSYGVAEEAVGGHVARMNEQLHPSLVTINGTQRDCLRADTLPHVAVLCAMVDERRFVSVVIDRTIASSLNLQLADFPSALD